VDLDWNVSRDSNVLSTQILIISSPEQRSFLLYLRWRIAFAYKVFWTRSSSSHDTPVLRIDRIASVARAISDYLTSETGVTIYFESAIVPKWKDSRISFKNVHITRRPKIDSNSNKNGRAVHAAALGYDVSNHPANHTIDDEEDDADKHQYADEDVKWSMFDLDVDSIDVTLSLWQWLDGKGLVKDAVVKGVRGALGAYRFSAFRVFSPTFVCRSSLDSMVS
jgi:hypothetical protein